MPEEVPDQIVDFVWHWSEKTEIGASQWLARRHGQHIFQLA